MTRWQDDPARVRPMLATLADPPLQGTRLVYEPKYDGIRALVDLQPSGKVAIWSRLGNPKTAQFPELVAEFERWARRARVPLFVDGEIVALDDRDRPTSFLRIQPRLHVTSAPDIARLVTSQPVAFYAFDLLRDDEEDVRRLPLLERRGRLERRIAAVRSPKLRLSEVVAGDGTALHARAETEGWEGLVVKDAGSRYESGRRSPAWRKLKIPRRQDFIVGGWTDPGGTRQHFGALLLGVAGEDGKLKFVGQTGSGFSDAELTRVAAKLRALASEHSPFEPRSLPPGRHHWIDPRLVADVKFTEWTNDGKLRHPIYLGLKEQARSPAPDSGLAARGTTRARGSTRAVGSGLKAPGGSSATGPARTRDSVRARLARGSSPAHVAQGFGPARPPVAQGSSPASRTTRPALGPGADPRLDALVSALQDLEDRGRDGAIELPNGDRMNVTNLTKVFWPRLGITKGELLRYYVAVSPFLLPAVADRPLVMKRFPNGINGKAFYQQRVKDDERLPSGVRIEVLGDDVDPTGERGARRLVGGSLTTLLYMAQMAAISQDPWFSRVGSPFDVDAVALDLDPMDGVGFAQVLDVARWIRDELQALGVPGVPKTSGSRGLHIYLPMPPGTTYQSGQIFCQIIATVIAARHPKTATVERAVKSRGRTVYVDFLQNILGKTLATAYSVRASEFAGVSTPLRWDELDGPLDPRDFTIRTALGRFAEVGDLWARLRAAQPADLTAVYRYGQ